MMQGQKISNMSLWQIPKRRVGL